MNWVKTIIAAVLIIGSIIASILTEGLLLPISVPLFFYGLKLMGVKLE